MRSPVVPVFLALALSSAATLAQEPSPPLPAPPGPQAQPPSYPPPYYQPYPYGYPPPGAYSGGYPPYQPPPPQQYQLPARMPYKEGAPIPVGYHVEELPNRGLVLAGWLTTAIPYGIGLLAAGSADFKNQSGWLAAPIVGPWLMLGQRDYGCEGKSGDAKQSLDCLGDVFLVMGLITDGVIQAAGGSLLLAGYLATKPVLIRDVKEAVRVRPMQVGTGYGLGVHGLF